LSRGESISKILQGDVFSSFCYDDPNLLKDMSLADWSESLQDKICDENNPLKAHDMILT
jgi:hypothetical protein